MKEFECVEDSNHNDIGKIIEEWQKNGWHLHTYQAAGMRAGPLAYKVNHYLLFERETCFYEGNELYIKHPSNIQNVTITK